MRILYKHNRLISFLLLRRFSRKSPRRAQCNARAFFVVSVYNAHMQGKIERVWGQFQAVPLLWFSLSFLIGISFAAAVGWPLAAWWALLGMALLVWIFSRRLRLRPSGWRLALTLFTALLLGALRYQLTQSPPTINDAAYYVDRQASLVGMVARLPVQHDAYTEVRLRVEYSLSPDGTRTEVDGMVLVRLSLDADWNYGDRLRIDGFLEAPADGADFSYADYLARFGIQAVMSFPDVRYVGAGDSNPILTALYAFKASALETIYQMYPDPEASLFAGILLGDETGLSADLKTAYNDTGLRHIIAISGFNITIIAGVLLAAFGRWFGARRGAWLAALGIALYTVLVGADAAVLRAAIMGGLALLARQAGRRQWGLNTLAITAAVMAAFNPLLLWDVGFQLSFAATLGILLYTEPMSSWLRSRLAARFRPDRAEKLTIGLSEFVVITLAAQITTLPLLLYHFQRLSTVSLLANLLVLPAQPALMVAGGLSVLAGLVLLPFGRLLALFAWPLAAYSNRMAELLASLPGASYAIAPFGFSGLLFIYLLLFGLTLGWDWLRPRLPRPKSAFTGAVLMVLCIWLWSAALSAPDGHLQLTLLDVADGEALLVRTPQGRYLLINGGSSGVDLAEGLGQNLPAFNRRVDWLVVAGVRQEQLAGLVNGVERLAPGSVAWAGEPDGSLAAEQLRGRLLTSGISPQSLQSGERFDLGEGAYLEVVDSGNRGALLMLDWEGFRAILPLGLDFEMLERSDNGWAFGPIDLLVLADNGYLPLNPASWIETLDPTVIWLSGNSAPPSHEMLQAIAGRNLLRNDLHGWLRITTDGQQLWIETER